MADTVLVTILRRNEEELTTEEREALVAAFPGKEVIFRRTDPRDFMEHAKECRELKPAAVILPRERPIPSLAMEEGFAHVTYLPNQGLVELEPLVPAFKSFAAR
jgi:hypothetical protein